MACWKKKCERTGEDVYSLALTRSSIPPIFGPPGTKCREVNPFGLCKPNKSKSLGNIEREIQKGEKMERICSSDPVCKKAWDHFQAANEAAN